MLAHRQLRAGIAAASAIATTACQTYTRVPRAQLEPGGEVQVELTDRGAQQLAYQLGPRVALVEGRIRERDRTSVLVSVTQITRYGAQEESWPGDTIRLTDETAASMRVRRVSRGRSLLLAGAIVAGAALAAATGGAGSAVGSGTAPPPSGGK